MEKVFPSIIHHGGAEGVTGSCHRYVANDTHHLLVDCGLFQGEDAGPSPLEQHQVTFDISAVKALIVTHVHIDHIGRLPYLMSAGFDGPIICTPASAKLLPLIIEDALKLGFTRDRRLIERFLSRVNDLLLPVEFDSWMPLPGTLDWKVRFQRAGHILGSAFVEIDLGNGHERPHRTVFSGDLGTLDSALLPGPKSPERADILVIESTYGDRVHEDPSTRRARLKEVVAHALENRGTVLIPAFSIGRTQELLYEIEQVIGDLAAGMEDGAVDVVVDSPLAAKFNEVYRELLPLWDAEVGDGSLDKSSGVVKRHPLSFSELTTIDSHQQHEQAVRLLASTHRPAIVIAASGMLTGGRVMNYLKAMIEDPVHDLLFVGYQASGTLGSEIQRKGQGGRVRIDDQEYNIKMGVYSIGGFSAHGDQSDLVAWVRGMNEPPVDVRIVHGIRRAREALADALDTL
ncbi:MAG: MBL fold metallo-hydrolase [Natronospirillum sp.]